MAEIMIALGAFRFSLPTASYDDLRRRSGWTWAEQARTGLAPSLQFTGKEVETITLSGVIYPEFRGGFGQIEAMRQEADAGVPLMLVDGTGEVLGRWVITSIDENQRVFWPNGKPRGMEFTLNIKKYDDA